MKNTLYFVIPCYNEGEVLPQSAIQLRDKVRALTASGKISEDSRIVFVNDGSSDSTWELISRMHDADKMFSGISLAHNAGHQNAVLCGLMTVRKNADMVISMDADMQDDIDAVDAMVDKYLEGADIVYGVRSNRDSDTSFKRNTAGLYYTLLKKMGVNIIPEHADFRLMSRRALEALSEFKEQNLFLRGIVPLLGFNTATVSYVRKERLAGTSKYPLKKMLNLAADGITGFSMTPIRMISLAGIVSLGFAFALLLFSLLGLIWKFSMLNWKIILVSIFGVGGVILLSLGILGEYIFRISVETKARPRYIVDTVIHKS